MEAVQFVNPFLPGLQDLVKDRHDVASPVSSPNQTRLGMMERDARADKHEGEQMRDRF
jgi:hypothetical protein